MTRCRHLFIILALTLAFLTPVAAEDLLAARSTQSFPEAMLTLQESIREHGYTVSRVQRVDIGLTNMGYQTDKYRVVFFGKIDEVRELSNRHPEMIPYLPMNISVIAEGDQTILITSNPAIYKTLFSKVKNKFLFDHWENDIRSIFNDIREAE